LRTILYIFLELTLSYGEKQIQTKGDKHVVSEARLCHRVTPTRAVPLYISWADYIPIIHPSKFTL
jgi:hypothetical protein